MELKVIGLQEDKKDKAYVSVHCQQVLSVYDDFYPKIGFVVPWVGYFITRQNEIVGCCGFTGQPANNKVEIAYYTFKEFEGEGIASFACRQLIAIAYHACPALTITAKTAPVENASTKILQNNGFVFSEIVQDEEIGNAWLWIHKR